MARIDTKRRRGAQELRIAGRSEEGNVNWMIPYPWSELDGWLALFRAELWRDPRHERSWSFVHDLDHRLARIQRELAVLSRAPGGPSAPLGPERLEQLEAECRALSTELEPLRAPLSAGGGVPGCTGHLARAVCQRIRLELEPSDAMAVEYLARLEPLLFVMARAIALKLGYEDPPRAT